ncbi:hypothetical protein GL263_27670, partial [Streptomyces durbertensis]
MRIGRIARTAGVGLPSVALLLGLTAACNPHMYEPVPSATGLRPADVVGTWHGANRTEVELRADGTAAVRRLDGREFDFDQGWRLTGEGEWELTDQAPGGWGEGQHVVLRARAGCSEFREEDDRWPAPGGRQAAPAEYRWVFELDGTDGGVRPFFLFGDPDSRSRYYLDRAPEPWPRLEDGRE